MSKTAIGILTGVCVAAGAGGAYLALGDRAREPEPSGVILTYEPGPEAHALEPPQQETRESPGRISATSSPPRPEPAPSSSTSRPTRPALPETPPVARQEVRAEEPVPADVQEYRSEPAAIGEPAVSEEPAFVSEAEPEPVLAAEALEAPPLDTWVQTEPEYEELVIAAESVVGLRIQTALTSERAQVEDPVVAEVARDVRVQDRVVIPEGAKAYGNVTLVERGGRLRDRARLGVEFTLITLADGTRLTIDTDTIYREGESPGNESAAKIGGGAIGGAIIGGILGGARGAAIGGTAGAGAGTTAVLAGGRNAATLPAGTPLTLRLRDAVSIIVEK